MPIAKSKANELVDRLNRIIASCDFSDRLTVQRLKRDANALLEHDAAAAHMIFGMIAAGEGKKEELEKHHALSLKLGIPVDVGNLNFAVSLRHAGYHIDALEYARKALSAKPDDSEIVRMLIDLNVVCLRFQETLNYLDQLKKLGASFEKTSAVPNWQSIVDFMDKHALRDDDLANISYIGEILVHEKKLNSQGKRVYLRAEGGMQWLCVEDNVVCSPSTAVDANFELADRLVESNSDSDILSLVSYRFVPQLH